MKNRNKKYIFQNSPSKTITLNSSIMIQIVNDMGKFKQFYELPFTIYAKKEHWIPPFWNELRDFFKINTLFWTHAECILFLAIRNNKPVGRIAAIIDSNIPQDKKTLIGYFGFFECVDDYAVAYALLESAKYWLKERGMTYMHGPVNGRVDMGSGFVIKGFDTLPYLLGHYSKGYYVNFMNEYGMKKEKDLISYHVDLTKDIPSKVQESVRHCKLQGITIRKFNRLQYNKEMKWWISMLMQEFADHWGYTSISEKEVKERFGLKQLRWIVDPKLFFIAEHQNQPIGFRWSLPDYNLLFKDMNGKMGISGILKTFFNRKKKITRGRFIIMGIKKNYRGMAIGTYMNYHTLLEMKKRGYRSAEYGWIDETNIASRKAGEKMGGTLYKIYRVYKISI